jgi:uncharacterized protein
MRDPTLLGKVESVTGSTISVGLDAETLSGLVYIEGQGHRIGQVGGFIRIPQGFTNLFGIVSQAGAAAAPKEITDSTSSRRWLTVEIVGEGRPGVPFFRGVYRYPTIDDEVHLVTESDLVVIYGSATSRDHVEIGSLSSSRSIPARVEVNKLITRHSAVVGATGSGKSTTVAGIIHKLADKDRFPSARIILLDLHGEYADAFRDNAMVYKINADINRGEKPLYIPYWALTFDELIPLAFGSLDDAPRGRINELISERRQAQKPPDLDAELVTVDTPLPFSLRQLWYDLKWEIEATYPRSTEQTRANAKVEDAGDPQKIIAAKFKQFDGTNIIQSKSTLPRRPLEILASKLRDPRLQFLFSPGPWDPDVSGKTREDLDSLLSGWLGSGGKENKPITILDLSGVPTGITADLVGALLRLLFDGIFWGRKLSEGGRHRPLLIVMEEAHLYLSSPNDAGGKATNNAAGKAVKRIVKEGRKYGIGAMIVSQRPTEIDPTILSQCGTFIALRMGNSQDRSHITSATSDNLKGIMDLLPTLRTGEALIVGEAVHIPTRVMITKPPIGKCPNSDDPRVVETEYAKDESGPGGWDRDPEKADYSDLVSAWRKQDPQSRKIKPQSNNKE